MMQNTAYGEHVLRSPIKSHAPERYKVYVVRDLNDFHKMSTVRALTYMSEQNCPYDEEFDGNDFVATHLLAENNTGPVGTMRIRWFADFVKFERVCILPEHRGDGLAQLMLGHAAELVGRKGFRRVLFHAQARLVDLWSHTLRSRCRENRPVISFSGYDYVEMEMWLDPHPETISIDSDPYVLLRPEGDWDRAGILDVSADRNLQDKAA